MRGLGALAVAVFGIVGTAQAATINITPPNEIPIAVVSNNSSGHVYFDANGNTGFATTPTTINDGDTHNWTVTFRNTGTNRFDGFGLSIHTLNDSPDEVKLASATITDWGGSPGGDLNLHLYDSPNQEVGYGGGVGQLFPNETITLLFTTTYSGANPADYRVEAWATPIPPSAALFGSALGALALVRRRKAA